EKAAVPYRYGINDCATFACAACAAVTGVTPEGLDRPPGMLAAAKLMIARGWESIEDAAIGLLGPPVDVALSRPGDLVSYAEAAEIHLAVRVDDTAVSPADRGLKLVDRPAWRHAWKVG